MTIPRCAVQPNKGVWLGRLPQRGPVRVDTLESCPGTVDALRNRTPLPKNVRAVYILCPGNPGVVDFYDEFILQLAFRCPGTAVVAVGFIGHTTTRDIVTSECYDLQDQIEMFNDFFANGVFNRGTCPPIPRVVVGGHSIGGYVMLQMAARFPKIAKATLLAPTVAEMALTPNGQSSIKYGISPPGTTVAAGCVVPLLKALPEPIRRLVVARAEPHLSGSQFETVLSMCEPKVVRNMLFLARSEFKQVAELDESLLLSTGPRLVLYFARLDGWVPLELAHRVARAAGDEATVIMEPRPEVSHAWCCGASAHVAEVIAPFVSGTQ